MCPESSAQPSNERVELSPSYAEGFRKANRLRERCGFGWNLEKDVYFWQPAWAILGQSQRIQRGGQLLELLWYSISVLSTICCPRLRTAASDESSAACRGIERRPSSWRRRSRVLSEIGRCVWLALGTMTAPPPKRTVTYALTNTVIEDGGIGRHLNIDPCLVSNLCPSAMEDTPIDYDSEYISQAGRRWQPSGIRGLFPLEERPGMISMLAGKPNPATFPIHSIKLALSTPNESSGERETLELAGSELAEALQYGPTAGLGSFLPWIYQLQQQTHGRGGPKEEGWSCAIGAGSQELMDKAFSAICNLDDSILLETPVYSGTLGFLVPSGRPLIEIKSDHHGMSADHLEQVLFNWHTNPATRSLKFPKVVYTIPTGSNPTGCSAPLDRKRKILRLVRRYKLLLFEDDAYYFLHYNRAERAPSYFALEKSDVGQMGRVVRFDSFSKIISSGLRLGIVTGPTRIIEIINLHTSNTNLQASSLAQAIASKLCQHWGFDRFEIHCDQVAQFYVSKLQVVDAAARKHLTGLAEWNKPVAGMFLWIKLNIAIPGYEDQADSSALISTKAVEKGVLAVPGFAFFPHTAKTAYVRTSFSLIDEKLADEGFKRLADAVREARAELGLS
ncbi:hypothetical protein O181_016681 [Austropuccinia psidii MF-1]|uniref:Aminotransferase class I/classII large domain-containing protein n=1 Tax=Austropuccinia psidii MF-1 TaxID=1389203 RepID=A0A9Q3GRA0_9BASI|nr:hypothetical protein [Austropuccinia psidii MF-1]